MLTCRECIERLRPDDPRVPVGKYHHSTCDYFCNKPEYYRELEGQASTPVAAPQEIIYRHMGRQEFEQLEHTVREVKYLRGKVAELEARRKPKIKPTIYEGLTVQEK